MFACFLIITFRLVMDNLKKYQEEKLLGKGAFGKAFLVSDKVSGEKFVMK